MVGLDFVVGASSKRAVYEHFTEWGRAGKSNRRSLLYQSRRCDLCEPP
jgi:hypothetical protein